MKKRTHRLLSNPFDDDSDLVNLLGQLNLNTVQQQSENPNSNTVPQLSENSNPNTVPQHFTQSNSNTNTVQQNFDFSHPNIVQQKPNMEDTVRRLETAIQQLQVNSAAHITQLTEANNELLRKVNILETATATLQQQQPVATVTVTEYTDIVPIYTAANDIQLDAFKVIPEFNGDKRTYRSWRTQVSKLMKQIEQFANHPRYATALAIIRAKITGGAADILINNDTALNIDAIIDRLDLSYADQRPLYVIEAEMTNIKQYSKSLQEFYDAVNQALNMVLTKITMTYKEAAEQKSLIIETQAKAIRTFITGLNSPLIRTTLYGNMPDSLAKAFAIAQTIQYDSQHLHLENKAFEQQRNAKKSNETRPISNPNFRYQTAQPNANQKPNVTTTPQQQQPTPMEIDRSGQFVQKTQYHSNDAHQMKRQREPSFQYANKPSTSFQHFNKNQRVNNIDAEDIRSIYENSMDNNCDTETPECQSTVSEQESVFLDE